MLNIIFIGLVSFFVDISTEMVYPLIPLYLTSAFGATPILIGLIEGIAESLASLLKVFSGYLSDRYQKKKRLAFLGYTASLVYKLALLLAGSWAGILAARMIDRIGKGIRTAPRDVLVFESADPQAMGRAFGLHKALDMAGSALGILAAYLLLRAQQVAGQPFNYKRLFALSAIPTLLGLVLFAFIREKRGHAITRRFEPFWQNIRGLDSQLRLYLLVTLLFTLGNSSNTFLLLRAKNAGFDDVSVILLYFITNGTASLLAIPMGRLSDVIGRKTLLVTGYLVFAIVYLVFALAPGRGWLALTFALYGAYTAMITGVERAYIAEIAPPALKGTLLGLHATIIGIALLPASVIAGFLWTLAGPAVAFGFGAGLALTASLILLLLMKNKMPEPSGSSG